MRLVLWQEVQAAFTFACMGPGGSGLPGALGACALARMIDANRKIAGKTRWNKQDPFLSSQFSVLRIGCVSSVGVAIFLFICLFLLFFFFFFFFFFLGWLVGCFAGGRGGGGGGAEFRAEVIDQRVT